jgi:hypothetical protein
VPPICEGSINWRGKSKGRLPRSYAACECFLARIHRGWREPCSHSESASQPLSLKVAHHLRRYHGLMRIEHFRSHTQPAVSPLTRPTARSWMPL